MNFPNPKLAAIVDYQADFTAVTILDDIQIADDKQELKNCLLRDFRRCIEEEASKKKTAKDINVLLQEYNAVAREKEKLQKIVEEKRKVKKIHDDKQHEYENILNLYRKNLGFHMGTTKEVSEESDITFVFKNINKKNPQETFSISITTDGLNYKVISCQPMIDCLDELVTALCESNNLDKFIIQVRRKFCSITSVCDAN